MGRPGPGQGGSRVAPHPSHSQQNVDRSELEAQTGMQLPRPGHERGRDQIYRQCRLTCASSGVADRRPPHRWQLRQDGELAIVKSERRKDGSGMPNGIGSKIFTSHS